MRKGSFALLLILVLLLVACGGEDVAPTPPGAPPVAPTFTPPPVAAGETGVAPTQAPPPTEVPALPSATSAPPTVAPPPPDLLANPPAREPSPGRVTRGKTYPPGAFEFIHDQFGVPQPLGDAPPEFLASLPGVADGQCPLTGEAAPEGIATRRPINVRIDNSPQGRPQAGLENADVIWETMAEGGVTRLTVTFHCRTPGTLGPVRSARLIDLQLTPMLGAWLVHVGASQPVTDMIWASPFADRDIDEWAGDNAFYRIDPSQAPVGWLTTYATNEAIQGVIAGRGDVGLTTPLRGWRFDEAVPPGSAGAATSISVPYVAGTSTVNYRYDAASGRYLRYQGDNPHTTQRGAQIAPDNVIVLFAPMTVTPIVEDSVGGVSLDFRLYGQGRALLFRDGQVWDTTWRREGENVLVRVVGADGQPVPLTFGQTWVQIVEEGMAVSWQ